MKRPVYWLTLLALAALSLVPTGAQAVASATQSDGAYAASFTSNGVTNVFATTQRTSCFTPEAPYFTSNGPTNGYTGMSPCNGASNTGENLGPYATQAGSNPGYPATTAMLVKDHSESDIRVDPSNPNHIIGTVKWFVSAEGYNHLLGFFESFDGGATWPVQGHIPGYEGWTDNTDPVGAFDSFGNFYLLDLPYQFYYNPDGTHNFQINQNKEPNPSVPPEVISVSVRKHGASGASDWISTHNGNPDFVAPYDAKGLEPDKQWIAIDTNPSSPFFNRVYALWAVFSGCCTSQTFVSYAQAFSNGTHSDWSPPLRLPDGSNNAQGVSYVLPHVDPDGVLYTPLTNTAPAKHYCCDKITMIKSSDGGVTWSVTSVVTDNIPVPPGRFANTTFRDGIETTFTVGLRKVNGSYPLYVAYEDYGTGFGNVVLKASYDGGVTWSGGVVVNDNASPADEFQPQLAAAANGTIGVNFYDRRLACPAQGSSEAAAAGLALDVVNPNYAGSLPPYGASNYCVNASIQFFRANLQRVGQNVRISQHAFDPQLNAPHTGCAACLGTFIGDYFGNNFSPSASISTFVSTYDDGSNSGHYQQQVVARLAIP
ncbi:MAG TPA: sialidase family protein [Verrucomicrobiae bacterium]|nr:sialidase family protein [Verrucomicrobiae bacterium]